jgi:Na+-translocating ferredoxin:NAD+ oxidoreductase subunit A
MTYIFDIMMIAITAALINNFVLTYFMGICSFIGVSKNVGMAFGMGCAVTFVTTIASFISWAVTRLILIPGAPLTTLIAGLFVPEASARSIDLTILCYIVYIFSIAASVQFVEMYIKKFFSPLYKAFGVYLPLITTNCAILFACIAIMGHIVGVDNPEDIWDLGRSVTLGFFGGLGYTISISIMAGIREELELCDIPRPFRTAGMTLITGGILALAFMGFTGMDSGIRKAFMPTSETVSSINTIQKDNPEKDLNTVNHDIAKDDIIRSLSK